MARGPLTFRQSDVTRAVRAVRNAGAEVLRVEVDKSGKIVVVTSVTDKTEPPTERNSWDSL
jgi:hypothetical protein